MENQQLRAQAKSIPLSSIQMKHQQKKTEQQQISSINVNSEIDAELPEQELVETILSDEEPLSINDDENNNMENKPLLQIQEQIAKTFLKNPQEASHNVNKYNQLAMQEIKKGQFKKALVHLCQCESLLDIAAGSGKEIDRSLIIVVLFNIACVHQSMWVLESCARYMDGVIFNVQKCIAEDELQLQSVICNDSSDNKMLLSSKLHKTSFLLSCRLQYCAVLSQQGEHENALKQSQQALQTANAALLDCAAFATAELKRRNGRPPTPLFSQASTQPSMQGQTQNQPQPRNSYSVCFEQAVLEDALSLLVKLDVCTHFMQSEMQEYVDRLAETVLKAKSEQEYNVLSQQDLRFMQKVKKTLFMWKTNKGNNEKYFRLGLQDDSKRIQDQKNFQKESNQLSNARSYLGVQASNESRQAPWVEEFNIGSIMHMTAIDYAEFSSSHGEALYELSSKMLLHKIILQSVCYFTIATELRFIDAKFKQNSSQQNQQLRNKQDQSDMQSEISSNNQNQDSDKAINNNENTPALSELFHLKALQIVCSFVEGKCPYITHLITSYHKHYSISLESIPEEPSLASILTTEMETDHQKNEKEKEQIDFERNSINSSHLNLKDEQTQTPVKNNHLNLNATQLKLTNYDTFKKQFLEFKRNSVKFQQTVEHEREKLKQQHQHSRTASSDLPTQNTQQINLNSQMIIENIKNTQKQQQTHLILHQYKPSPQQQQNGINFNKIKCIATQQTQAKNNNQQGVQQSPSSQSSIEFMLSARSHSSPYIMNANGITIANANNANNATKKSALQSKIMTRFLMPQQQQMNEQQSQKKHSHINPEAFLRERKNQIQQSPQKSENVIKNIFNSIQQQQPASNKQNGQTMIQQAVRFICHKQSSSNTNILNDKMIKQMSINKSLQSTSFEKSTSPKGVGINQKMKIQINKIQNAFQQTQANNAIQQEQYSSAQYNKVHSHLNKKHYIEQPQIKAKYKAKAVSKLNLNHLWKDHEQTQHHTSRDKSSVLSKIINDTSEEIKLYTPRNQQHQPKYRPINRKK